MFTSAKQPNHHINKPTTASSSFFGGGPGAQFFQPKLVQRKSHESEGQSKLLAPYSFEDSPHTGEKQPVAQKQSVPSQCISLVSFSVTPSSPSISAQTGGCRLGIGYCPTPRGQCGASSTGVVMSATVSAPANCTGKLAFAQNVLFTNRRRTMTDGTQECITANAAHSDGGIPWKRCEVDVNAPGNHTIESDDCPNAQLEANMTSTNINERFKTFLLWKPDGQTSRQALANATWGWGASATRQQTGQGCAKDWSTSNPTITAGTGSISPDRPVSNPSIQTVNYQPCTP